MNAKLGDSLQNLGKANASLQHAVPSASPRQAIAESYCKSFIDAESAWLAVIEDRNLTVHTFDETLAQQMATRIATPYLPAFDAFLVRLQAEVSAL
jgi:hypothetical protein